MKLARSLFYSGIVTVLSLHTAFGQNPCSQGRPYRGCKACGTAKSQKAKTLNVQKNRGTKATHPSQITVAEIRDPANNDTFSPSRQVWVTAFVASVGPGGFKETCNCKRADLRDVHINVVADPSEVGDKTKYVVVEFTPRWEKKFDFDDSDYEAMVSAVKSQIENKWVKFEGWMLYDFLHANESKSTAPDVPTCTDHEPNPCIWRATPWEVHPVTAYTVVPGP
jgi:hypothetical protein